MMGALDYTEPFFAGITNSSEEDEAALYDMPSRFLLAALYQVRRKPFKRWGRVCGIRF